MCRRFWNLTLPALSVLALVFSSMSCQPPAHSGQAPVVTHTDAATFTQVPILPELALPTLAPPTLALPSQVPAASAPHIPYELISQDSLLAYLEDLTSIQPYSGWRNSASRGEAEALDYVAGRLSEFSHLQAAGLALERQAFPVYLSTELWDSGLTLTVNQQEFEVPAEGLRASRYDRHAAAYLDSDGILNDSEPDPMQANGPPLLILDQDALYTLRADEFAGRILIVDYSVIDRYVIDQSEAFENFGQIAHLIDQGAAGLVIVIHYSNQPGEGRGTLLGDGSFFQRGELTSRVPVVYVRLEDLSPAGIVTLEDLRKIENAVIRLDTDVFSPGQAGNLIARLPGADSSKAVILGAHIDSPNGPGAFDDGSGSAALLEVARVLDVSQIQPPVDVYLAWFGGHEIGVYGSSHFAATHPELMDQTLALFQMDGLGLPMEGNTSKITMGVTPYTRFGEERLAVPDFLSQVMASQGLSLDRYVEYGLIADNSSFDVYNVPNVYLGYMNAGELRTKGSSYIHYSNHWHDPYETVEHAREVGGAFVQMTQVMLTAALETGRLRPELRVTPTSQRRALFVASHTESASLLSTLLRDLGMALAWEGFDVDIIPYGQAILPADLENVSLVILPPTLLFPGNAQDNWSEAELAVLDDYIAQGGLVLVINSASNFANRLSVDQPNQNARSLNAFLEPMGIAFTFGGGLYDSLALAVADHPLTAEAGYLTLFPYNGVPFRMKSGLELMQAGGHSMVGLVDYGEQGGQVLVVADLGLLQADSTGAKNVQFLMNFARYAANR